MKKPDVPWRCGSVSRNSGPLGCANSGHSALSDSAESPDASTTSSFSLSRSCRPSRRWCRPAAPVPRQRGAARPEARGAALRASGGPAWRQARRARSTGRPRALGRTRKVRREVTRIGVHDLDVLEPEQPDILLELPSPTRMELHGDDLRCGAGELRRLPRRARRTGSSTRSPDWTFTTAPASCDPRLCGQTPRRAPAPRGVDAVDDPRLPGRNDAHRSLSAARSAPA